MADVETEYCLRRAREEAHRALTAEKPEVAAAHHGMSVRYSARALMLRVNTDHRESPAMPQLHVAVSGRRMA